VSGNSWVGEHSVKESPHIARISPYFFGQHGLLNLLYLPKLRDLPAKGLDFKALVFDFGFDQGSVSLGPLATAKLTLVVEKPLLIWGVAGVSSDLSAPYVGYNFQLLHSHNGVQRQFFNKAVNDGEILGSGARLALLRSPYMVIRGDELTCQVSNLSNNQANPGDENSNVQVVLYGGEFE